MAYTESNMLPLGTKAPSFSLLDPATNKTVNLEEIVSDVATVVMFICNHCPYVIHVNNELVRLAKDYQARGVAFVAINSNDVKNYPADSPEKMVELATEVGYTFPYLYDESQAVAKAYDAACTPDFYVFDKDQALQYRGQLDGSRPGHDPSTVNGADLRAALDTIIAGKKIEGNQRPSAGCNIKWKK